MVDSDFYELVENTKDRVYNTCLSFVKDHEDAEDLAQEVYIEVFQKWDSFRHEAWITTWLYRISVNKSLEFIRKSKRLKRSGKMSSPEMALEKEADRFYHPGVSLENKERSAILYSAIEKLPELQQIAFTLQKIEGLSQEEISKVMKKSVSSVESLLQRAKKKLRSQLKPYYERG